MKVWMYIQNEYKQKKAKVTLHFVCYNCVCEDIQMREMWNSQRYIFNDIICKNLLTHAGVIAQKVKFVIMNGSLLFVAEAVFESRCVLAWIGNMTVSGWPGVMILEGQHNSFLLRLNQQLECSVRMLFILEHLIFSGRHLPCLVKVYKRLQWETGDGLKEIRSSFKMTRYKLLSYLLTRYFDTKGVIWDFRRYCTRWWNKGKFVINMKWADETATASCVFFRCSSLLSSSASLASLCCHLSPC